MRYLFSTLLLALTSWAVAQICPSQSAGIPVSGWTQLFDADWFSDAPYLDALNQPELGTGVSDSNLAILSNEGISAFIGVKRRAVIAPADNLDFVGGKYQAPVGFSPTSATDATPTSLAAWNFLVYIDLGDFTFADVDIRMYIDFDPCHTNGQDEMFELSFADLMALSNLDPSEVSELATNQNIASNAWGAFNDGNISAVDPLESGYYTLALAVYDACGNQKIWHEVVVAVSPDFGSDLDGNGVADANDVSGCQLPTACNFDCTATLSDGSCEFISCSGCSVSTACNYNPEAAISNAEACLYPQDIHGSEWVDCNGDCLNDADGDGVCDEDEVSGCLNDQACNYNASATDEGGCTYPADYLDCNGNCLNDSDGDGVCDELEVGGCTAQGACNYDVEATNDDGSCEYLTCAGCTVVQACNYNASATISATETCEFPVDGLDCDGNCLNDDDEDGICNFEEIAGCTDSLACNFSSVATDDDGSCSFAEPHRDCSGLCENDVNANGICDEEEVVGCTNGLACNYNPLATFNSGCDTSSCVGCTDPSSCTYDETATIPDYSQCTYPEYLYNCAGTPLNDANSNGIPDQEEVFGCTSVTAVNYNPLATTDNGSCVTGLVGCMLPWAPNYNEAATVQGLPAEEVCFGVTTGGMPAPAIGLIGCLDESACNYAPGGDVNDPCDYSCFGCTNELACDYDASATYNTGCADFDSCYGCTDVLADNYDGTATLDDGSCIISGCTVAAACNYSAAANSNDGSCEFSTCLGCTDEDACNFDVGATLENGQCLLPQGPCDSCSLGSVVDNDLDNDGVCNADEVVGCTVPGACNYNAAATDPSGLCVFASGCDYCSGETDGTGTVVNGDSDENLVCDVLEVSGCVNPGACNYNSLATQSDGSCEYDSCVGCMDNAACNFDPDATLSEPISCIYAATGYGCDGECSSDTDGDGVCDANEVSGCTNATACNYDESATDEDGTCQFAAAETDCDGACLQDEDQDGVCDALEVLGCTNDAACNFNQNATESDGTCEFTSCAACGDSEACNYVSDALAYDLTLCTYPAEGYEDCDGTICIDIDEDGICDLVEIPSCIGEFNDPVIVLNGIVDLATDPALWGDNTYLIEVTDENEVEVTFEDYVGRLNNGVYSVTRIYVATDACGNASESGQLLRAVDQIEGCTDPVASNYNEDAVNNNGTCSYDPACLGDLNEDGIIGASDLLVLLSGFGIPCE